MCTNNHSKLKRVEKYLFKEGEEEILIRASDGDQRIYIPKTLQYRVLWLRHYRKFSGHPRGRRLYQSMRRSLYRPSLEMDCYAVGRNWTTCEKNRVSLRKKSEENEIIHSHRTTRVRSDRHTRVVDKSSRGNWFLLVIDDKLFKIVRKVTLESISAASVAKEFVTNGILPYGPPKRVLLENGKKFTSKFFQNVCRKRE